MSQALMQYSFHAGELAPALNARVDISKYKSGAATMLNFYPDYRGGASSRPGTAYCLRAKSTLTPRLIPFQPSPNGGGVNYVIEAGDKYMRFYSNGQPVKENPIVITAASQTNPCTITSQSPHGYAPGDWIFTGFSGVGAFHPLAARYFIVASVPTSTTFTINDLYGHSVDATGYGPLAGNQFVSRIYTLITPLSINVVFGLKYAQNANTLLLTHQSISPMLLQLISTNPIQFVLSPAVFGTTISPPTVGAPSSTLAAGSVNYAYAITSVDSGGQESTLSTIVQLNSLQDIRTVAGTNVINWTAQPGAVTYNVYRAEPSYAGVVPTGAAFGFIGNANGTSFVDSNIAPDFSQAPPVAQNPFQGQSVIGYTVTAAGSYTSAPSVQIGAPSAGGQQATAETLLTLLTAPTINNPGSGYSVGQQVVLIQFFDPSKIPVAIIKVNTVSGSGIATFTILSYPSIGPGQTAPTQLADINGGSLLISGATWGVGQIVPLSIGSGYLSTPSITFSPAGATATLSLSGTPSTSNPAVCTYFQQRLVLAAPSSNPQEFNMSQTGAYFNFNISNPVSASDAIQGSLVSFQINTIKSMTPMSTGLLVMSDRAVWLINGGSIGSPVSPSQIVATQHSYIGASDIPPIVINFDILYVQAKNSIVRDLTYNFYAQIYTGTDISILSSHLFYGYQLSAWAYAEEPFKLIWCVRNDGALLSLTYLKEQEIIGWSRHNTQGSFASVCSITENGLVGGGGLTTNVDAVYFLIQRTINGQTFYCVERLMERQFISPKSITTPTATLAWCVDCGGQGGGSSPISTVGPLTGTGVDHLLGATIVGLADGVPFTTTVSGNPPSFTVPTPAKVITFGLSYTPQLQTLQLDTGEPTSQGKRKKIPAVTVRVQDTLGLSIGKTFNSLVPMKDLVKGNLNVPSNTVVNDLFTGDARTILDPTWDVPGQYCIQQSNPWPATILGVIPEIVVGDTPPK